MYWCKGALHSQKVDACLVSRKDYVTTKFGKCIRFMSKKLRLFKGRSSKGIRGINLAEKDSIVSLSIIDHNSNQKKVRLKKNN